MPKWEYRIINSSDVAQSGVFSGRARESLEAYLNELGNQGWEIVRIQFGLVNTAEFVGLARREKRNSNAAGENLP